MNQYVMGIDVGTNETKGVLVDENCRIVADAAVAHTMDKMCIRDRTKAIIRVIYLKGGISCGDVIKTDNRGNYITVSSFPILFHKSIPLLSVYTTPFIFVN